MEKNGTFKNKNIQCPGENKNKRFNEREKVIPPKKKIEERQKRKYVNVKINGINIKLQLDTGNDISIIHVLMWK